MPQPSSSTATNQLKPKPGSLRVDPCGVERMFRRSAPLHLVRSRSSFLAVLGGWLFALLATVGTVRGQGFQLSWFTIDSGGGSSSGVRFAVTGTIAQPDAGGGSSGGPFVVQGGFWSAVEVVQTPGAPEISAHRQPGSRTIIIRWTLPDDGWELVKSPTLGEAPHPWTLVPPASYETDGTYRYISIPSPNGRMFFRLERQGNP